MNVATIKGSIHGDSIQDPLPPLSFKHQQDKGFGFLGVGHGGFTVYGLGF